VEKGKKGAQWKRGKNSEYRPYLKVRVVEYPLYFFRYMASISTFWLPGCQSWLGAENEGGCGRKTRGAGVGGRAARAVCPI